MIHVADPTSSATTRIGLRDGLRDGWLNNIDYLKLSVEILFWCWWRDWISKVNSFKGENWKLSHTKWQNYFICWKLVIEDSIKIPKLCIYYWVIYIYACECEAEMGGFGFWVWVFVVEWNKYVTFIWIRFLRMIHMTVFSVRPIMFNSAPNNSLIVSYQHSHSFFSLSLFSYDFAFWISYSPNILLFPRNPFILFCVVLFSSLPSFQLF